MKIPNDYFSQSRISQRYYRVRWHSQVMRRSTWCTLLAYSGWLLWGLRSVLVQHPFRMLIFAGAGLLIAWTIFAQFKDRLAQDPFFAPLRIGERQEQDEQTEMAYVQERKMRWLICMQGLQFPIFVAAMLATIFPVVFALPAVTTAQCAAFFLPVALMTHAQSGKTPTFTTIC